VYDKLDRVVATGPAFYPFGEEETGWMITKYDVFNRPVYTGWLPANPFSSTDRKNYQEAINGATVLNEIRKNTTVDTVRIDYSNNVEPINNLTLLTVAYYDDYAFPNAITPPTTILGQPLLNNLKGLATGSWVRVLTHNSEYLNENTTTFYDQKARPVATYKTNYLRGATITQSLLNFSGQVLHTETTHNRTYPDEVLTVVENFEYTPQGRLLNHFHSINGGTTELIAHNDYDELGKLITKNVGGQDTTTFVGLQKVDYQYNIRGWLTGINNTANLNDDSVTDLFAFQINYNNPQSAQALYNGNISETLWRTSSDNTLRKYAYTYDSLNRLRAAEYQKPDYPVVVTNAYYESMEYDKNGNIIRLQRNGGADSENTPIEIDKLSYFYDANNTTNRQTV